MKRLKQRIDINGQQYWLTGSSFQDLLDRYEEIKQSNRYSPLFCDYARKFFSTFKFNQEQNTLVNRERIFRNHIEPKFFSMKVDEISIDFLQEWFNELSVTYSHETILKIKNTVSTVLNAAVDDGYIARNPLSSNRLMIGGKDIRHHKAIPHDRFVKAKSLLPVMTGREKVMAALLCYTGMRFEEILGLKWEDFRNKAIYITRAVTHPTRNQPIIKKPKTKTSCRVLPQQREMMMLLKGHISSGFVLSKSNDGKEPLSYTEARTVFSKVQKGLDLNDYTAHDFRDTCATEWREDGIPIDVISRLLGHSKSDVTETIYVKYRDNSLFSYFDL